MATTKDLIGVLVKDTCYIQDCARVVHAGGGLMVYGGIFAVDKNNAAEIGKVIKLMLSTPLKIISEEEYMKELNSKEVSLIMNLTKTKSYKALAKISKDVAIKFIINDDKVKFTPYKKIDSKGNMEQMEDKAMVAAIDNNEELGQTLLQTFHMSE